MRRLAIGAVTVIGLSVAFVLAQAPSGYTDGFNAETCAVSGWAVDVDTNTPIIVRAYRDAEGSQALTDEISADLPRSDGLPGYNLRLPVGFDDAVYVYAEGRDVTGAPDGERTMLPLYSPNVPDRHVTCATAPDSAETSATVTTTLGFSMTLGPVQPIMNRLERGIWGATPDGRISAFVDGALTRIFFSCNDGMRQLSCLAEPSSVTAFDNLSPLFADAGGRFRSVMAGNEPGDPYQDKYAALMSTWRDPSTGIVHGWYHAEIQPPGCSGGMWASIGYAQSTDNGHTFTKYGPVITSPLPPQSGGICGQGVAEPNVIASGGFLYMLYDFMDPLVWSNGGISLARANINNPAVWTKYGPKFHGSNYNEPGLGGAEHPVVPVLSNGQQVWSDGVSFNAYLQKYLLLHTDYNHEGNIYLRTSSNLTTWSTPQLVMSAGLHTYRYASFLSTAGDHTTSQSGWLYFARQLGTQPPGSALMARRSVLLLK